MFKNIICALLTVSMLSGCASSYNRAILATEQEGCTRGNQQSCRNAIQQEAINKQEASDNALKVATAIVLIPLFVLAAAAQANANQPDVIVIDHYHWR